MTDIAEEDEDFVSLVNRLFREELQKAIQEAEEKLTRELDSAIQNGWAPTGIRGIFDEAYLIQPSPPPSWTPKEFEKMWSWMDHESRVIFVKNLIS